MLGAMAPRKAGNRRPHTAPAFDVETFLRSAGSRTTVAEYRRGETIFTQGQPGAHVLYVRTGVTLSVSSTSGRDVVVATIGPGEFFGEGCLAGQPIRTGTATALTPCVVRLIRKRAMVQLLGHEPALADRFVADMLSRHIRIEQDLLEPRVHAPRQSACSRGSLSASTTQRTRSRSMRRS